MQWFNRPYRKEANNKETGQTAEEKKQSNTHDNNHNESTSSSSSSQPPPDPNTIAIHNDYFIVRKPLVLLICCSQYQGEWDDLPGVKKDRKILFDLFHNFYGCEVKSLHQNVTKEGILDFLKKAMAEIMISKGKR